MIAVRLEDDKGLELEFNEAHSKLQPLTLELLMPTMWKKHLQR